MKEYMFENGSQLAETKEQGQMCVSEIIVLSWC